MNNFTFFLVTSQPEPFTIAENLGCVNHMCFSKDDSKLAICISNEIWVINSQVKVSINAVFLIGFVLSILVFLINILINSFFSL